MIICDKILEDFLFHFFFWYLRSSYRLSYGLDSKYIDPVKVTLKVIEGISDGISTRELDALAAETCMY
jgi:hypothetical protein